MRPIEEMPSANMLAPHLVLSDNQPNRRSLKDDRTRFEVRDGEAGAPRNSDMCTTPVN